MLITYRVLRLLNVHQLDSLDHQPCRWRAQGRAPVPHVPEPPSYGQPYVTFLSPLREDEARLITAALAAYSGARESGQPCGECRSIKQEWATAQRGGDREGAAALAWSMGLHQRRAHT